MDISIREEKAEYVLAVSGLVVVDVLNTSRVTWRQTFVRVTSARRLLNLNQYQLQIITEPFRLVALVEVLQKRKLKHNKRPQSQPHALENITIALDAIQDDGIKLVNIGKPS